MGGDDFDDVFDPAFCTGHAFVIFTGATNPDGEDFDYAGTLADSIVANGLGTVTRTPQVENPNSGNLIQVFVWQPKWREVREHVSAKATT